MLLTVGQYSHNLWVGGLEACFMPDTKIVFLIAACAAALAFISGLFGRVSFGIVLLRTLIGGVLFGVFSYGAGVLLKRFIPEIFELSSGKSEEDDHDVPFESAENHERGGNLNIVLEGEDPSYSASDEEENVSFQTDDRDNGFIEEIHELESEAEDSSGKPASKGHSARKAAVSDSADILEDYGDLSDVDVLPDLEEFSDSFESVAAAQNDDSFSEKSRASNNKVDMLEGQHDPATVAKAVRTIIRRDQEG